MVVPSSALQPLCVVVRAVVPSDLYDHCKEYHGHYSVIPPQRRSRPPYLPPCFSQSYAENNPTAFEAMS